MSDANTAASAAKASPAAAFPDAAAPRVRRKRARAPGGERLARGVAQRRHGLGHLNRGGPARARRGGELEVEQGNLRPHLDGERGVGGVGVASFAESLGRLDARGVAQDTQRVLPLVRGEHHGRVRALPLDLRLLLRGEEQRAERVEELRRGAGGELLVGARHHGVQLDVGQRRARGGGGEPLAAFGRTAGRTAFATRGPGPSGLLRLGEVRSLRGGAQALLCARRRAVERREVPRYVVVLRQEAPVVALHRRRRRREVARRRHREERRGEAVRGRLRAGHPHRAQQHAALRGAAGWVAHLRAAALLRVQPGPRHRRGSSRGARRRVRQAQVRARARRGARRNSFQTSRSEHLRQPKQRRRFWRAPQTEPAGDGVRALVRPLVDAHGPGGAPRALARVLVPVVALARGVPAAGDVQKQAPRDVRGAAVPLPDVRHEATHLRRLLGVLEGDERRKLDGKVGGTRFRRPGSGRVRRRARRRVGIPIPIRRRPFCLSALLLLVPLRRLLHGDGGDESLHRARRRRRRDIVAQRRSARRPPRRASGVHPPRRRRRRLRRNRLLVLPVRALATLSLRLAAHVRSRRCRFRRRADARNVARRDEKTASSAARAGSETPLRAAVPAVPAAFSAFVRPAPAESGGRVTSSKPPSAPGATNRTRAPRSASRRIPNPESANRRPRPSPGRRPTPRPASSAPRERRVRESP